MRMVALELAELQLIGSLGRKQSISRLWKSIASSATSQTRHWILVLGFKMTCCPAAAVWRPMVKLSC